jgi:LysR family transcriptional regulator, cyn operon transcriptional activator
MDRSIIFPRAIRYLIAVAEHGSFTRAAEVLYVSQPTLSQQIKQLEDLLDVQLLDRSGRTVRLTAAGEVYMHHAKRAMGELDVAKRAIHDLQGLTRGVLRLGMTPITDYLATSLLEQFSARYPGIMIKTFEMPQDAIVAALGKDLDIGIAFSSTLSMQSSSEEIDTHVLFVESLCVAVGHSHPLHGSTDSVSKHTLEEIPLILLSADYALRRHIDLFCQEQGITPLVAMDASSLSVIIEMVRLGRLATIIPQMIADERHGLHAVRLIPDLPHHTVCMICRRGTHKSPACSAFVELGMKWHFRDQPMVQT